jgi:tRNA pseudouridine38-40 synthase
MLPTMPRFKLTLEYAGTRYSGWQIQKNARTVQGELQSAVQAATGEKKFELYGSGRTDAGVHALHQVAHLDIDTHLFPDRLRMSLNDALPSDINLLEIERVARKFHARHSAVARSYLYQIARRRTAFLKPYVWWIKDDLDVPKMRKAASLFLGMNDYRSFADADPEDVSTRVLVETLDVREEGELILIRMVGSHFLWKMVRRVVGVLADVGRGKLSMAEVARLLHEHSDIPARLTAPPSGLFLERVFYDDESRARPLHAAFPLPAAHHPRAAHD